MISLPQVTLICLTNKNIEGHKKAIEKCCEKIQFGAVKIVERPDVDTIDKWNYAMVYELGNYVDTDYALIIHDDGYIINPDKWSNDWLQYDYIGAPWPLPTDDYSYRDAKGNIVRVGNSVGLRSKRILDLPRKLGLEWKSYYGNTNEDGFLCCHNRHILEEHGCKFAPFEVAKYFSHETPLPELEGIEPFMFHRFKHPRL